MPSPEHEAFVAGLKPGGETPEVLPPAAVIAAMRAGEEAMPITAPAGFTATAAMIGAPAVWVQTEGAAPARTVLYLHGGGYVFLSAKHFIPVMAKLAAAGDCRCLGLDYRKAPEQPFPAALEDAVATYCELLNQGIPAASIAIGGDSAGGGLALVTAIALRDRGLPQPAAVCAISPWTDLTVSGASVETVGDPVVTGAALRMMASTYLNGTDARDARASALHANLAGLPPLHIQVGTRERLLDDSRRLVAAARAAGADITYIEHPDVAHMWIHYNPEMPESSAAFAAIGQFLRERVDG